MFSSLGHFAARYNRVLPLWSANAGFRLLPGPDPRGRVGGGAEGEEKDENGPLAYYLQKVAVGHDPRGLVALWNSMEAALGLAATATSEKRVALSSRPVGVMASSADAALRTGADARRSVAAEAAAREARFAPDGIYARFGVENPDADASAAAVAARVWVPQAVGFWLVPAAALGPLPDRGVVDVGGGSNLVRDLSASRPQLALFDLC